MRLTDDQIKMARITYTKVVQDDFILDLIDTIEALQQENEQLQEFAKAKAEGRLVILPCKVGDTVYFTQNICEYKHCDTHTRMACCGCSDYAKNKFVIQSRAFTLMDLKDIGKTVFLTREEAEKALSPICNTTKLPCAECNPCCEHRKGE